MLFNLKLITKIININNIYEGVENNYFFGVKSFSVARQYTKTPSYHPDTIFITPYHKQQKIIVGNILRFYNCLVEFNDFFLVEEFKRFFKTLIKLKNLDFINNSLPIYSGLFHLVDISNVHNYHYKIIWYINELEENFIQFLVTVVSDEIFYHNKFLKCKKKFLEETFNNFEEQINTIDILLLNIKNRIISISINHDKLGKKIRNIFNFEKYLTKLCGKIKNYLIEKILINSNYSKRFLIFSFLEEDDCVNYFISCLMFNNENDVNDNNINKYKKFFYNVKDVLNKKGYDVKKMKKNISKNGDFNNFNTDNIIFKHKYE
jgi:hypothetical protein